MKKQKPHKVRDEARRKAAHHEIDLRTKSQPKKKHYNRAKEKAKKWQD